jgi:hypothetical protein
LRAQVRPSWATWQEAVTVILFRPHLRKTILTALIVGTIIFSINQLDVVLRHKATLGTYVKSSLTYLVPFCVSNYGILVGTHRTRQDLLP